MYKFAHRVPSSRRRARTLGEPPWPTTPPPTPHAVQRSRSEHRQHRARPPQAGDVGLPRLGLHVLRVADRDLPGLQGQVPARARPRTTSSTSRSPRYSAALLLLSSLTMVLALAALQEQPATGGGGLAARHRGARRCSSCGNQVYEFYTFVRPRRADAEHQPVRLHVLRAHRLPRRPRHRGRALAHDLWSGSSAGPAGPCATTPRSRSPGSTGTSWTSCGSRSSPSST